MPKPIETLAQHELNQRISEVRKVNPQLTDELLLVLNTLMRQLQELSPEDQHALDLEDFLTLTAVESLSTLDVIQSTKQMLQKILKDLRYSR